MNKSILVIDTPKSCSECEYGNKRYKIDIRTNCKLLKASGYDRHNVTPYKTDRHPQCPLKQIEDKEYYQDLIEVLAMNEMNLEARTIQDFIDTIYGSDE